MAGKVKAARRFKYNLETVLKVREIKEKKEQEKFAEKKRVFNKEKEREDQLKDQQRQRHDELKNMIGKGPIKDFADVIRRKAHLGVLKEEVEEQVEKVVEASRLMEEQRENLVMAMKDKKIMIKDKDNKKKQYTQIMEKLEMKFLDEIATQRFMHNMIKKK